MNSNAHESHFGPPSQFIDVAQFTNSLVSDQCVFSPSSDAITCQVHLSDDERKAIADECSVSDIKDGLIDTWNEPELAAHLSRNHAITLCGIHSAADTSNKRKRKRPKFLDPLSQSPRVTALQKELDSVQLGSWPLTLHSALFVRTSKHSDYNSFTHVKPSHTPALLFSGTHQALITLTVYNPVTWAHGYLSRASQHAVLSSQTLGDLLEVISCPLNELGKEIVRDDCIVGYENHHVSDREYGGVICIEGIAYGDGQDPDYADKLLSQVEMLPIDKRPLIKKSSTSMRETAFSSLSLRLNEPYWLFHHGNCEHFIVVDQIRLQHPSDPVSGYPLTLQVTPTLIDLCRACAKVPAVWAVVGDIRLGESPCLMCSVCWGIMGELNEDDEVLVFPLPKYEPGWRGRHNNVQ